MLVSRFESSFVSHISAFDHFGIWCLVGHSMFCGIGGKQAVAVTVFFERRVSEADIAVPS